MMIALADQLRDTDVVAHVMATIDDMIQNVVEEQAIDKDYYGIIAHITDYDVWHEEESPVTVEMVIQTLLQNAEAAKQATLNAIQALDGAPPSPYANALQDAIITTRDLIPEELAAKWPQLQEKYLQ